MDVRSLTVPFDGKTGRVVIPLLDLHNTIKLTPIGDLHLGNAGCDEAALNKWVDTVAADPNHYTVYMGDMADCILPGDKRFDPGEVAEWLWSPDNRGRIADAQYERVYELLKPIPKERVLGIIEGNHERTIRDRHNRDLTRDLARTLDIPYLGQEAFLYVTIPYASKAKNGGKQRKLAESKGGISSGRGGGILKIFITHGSGGGRKVGAKANKITDLTSWVNADIILCGHHHDKFATRTVQLDLDRAGHLVARERLHVLTGSFLKTYKEGTRGYGARELYPPTAIGPVTITIHPRTLELGTII